jgi:hypothetical protein
MKIDNIEIQDGKFIINLTGEVASYEDVVTVIVPQSELFEKVTEAFTKSPGVVVVDCTTCVAFEKATEPGFFCAKCPEKQEYCKLYEARG